MFRQAYVVQNACQGKMTSGRRENLKIGGENCGFGSVWFFEKTAVFGWVRLIVTTLCISLA
jgi:hypothetical protein